MYNRSIQVDPSRFTMVNLLCGRKGALKVQSNTIFQVFRLGNKTIFNVRWVYFIVFLCILQGCASFNLNKTGSPLIDTELTREYGQPRYVFTYPAIPTTLRELPLFPGQDDAKINEILLQFQQAPKVDAEDLRRPVRDRSHSLHIVFGNGETVTIRPAWHCQSEKFEGGNSGITCFDDKQIIWIQMPDDSEWFADSEELSAWVRHPYEKRMPEVKLFEFPLEVNFDESFQIKGQGWLAEKIRFEVSKERELIWSLESDLKRGQFDLTATITQEWNDNLLEPGFYHFHVVGIPYEGSHWGGDRMGHQVHIIK